MALPGNQCCFKDVLESHEWRLSSLNTALSSLIIVWRGLPGLGPSLTSLVALYLFNSLEMMEILRPSWRPVCLMDIRVFLMSIICHLVASANLYDVPWQLWNWIFNANRQEKVWHVIITNLISKLLRVCTLKLSGRMPHVNKSFRNMLCFLVSQKYRSMNWVLLN